MARLATGDPAGLDRLGDAAELAAERGALLHELWALTSLVEHAPTDDHRAALADLVERVGSGAPPADVAAARTALARA